MVVDENGVIRLANAQCEKLFGHPRDELIGQFVEMLVPADVRPRHAALRESFHRAPSPVRWAGTVSFVAFAKDGSQFPIEIGLSPLPARGSEGMQVAVSIRDVTERKEQERALKLAKAKAEEATQTKSMFLANMSHEIRTPMNAILNMTGLALEADLPPKPHQFINVAHSSAKNLLGILNDILDFSKIEADKLELESVPFSLREVLEEVTDTFRSVVIQKHVELITHALPTVPDRLRGDALRFRQVLTNLISNAFKFTEKGEVLVKVETADASEGTRPRRGAPARQRVGHRDRYFAGAAGEAVPVVHSGRQLDDAKVRRHGTRPRDQPAAGPPDGRRPDRRKYAGQGHDVRLHRAPRRRGPARGPDSCRPGQRRRAAGPHRGRHRDEPRAARDASAGVGRFRRSRWPPPKRGLRCSSVAIAKEEAIRSASWCSTGCCPA